MNLTELTISRAHQGLIKKDFSAKDLTLAFLEKIKKEDNEINSFLEVSEQLTLNQAQEVDKSIAQGKDLSILAGIPCAIKDNILVQDIRCSAASKILENYIAPYDATVVKKLKQQGAIILGKTNLDEFAMGSSTENSAFGPTHNPHDLARVPGGSSGGSAAAVAANMAVYALGSDTGGSIRQPASFCGVVGLKPTYGAVSRYGLMAFASSLDQIGTITKTVEDAKIVFDAIKGHDEMDSTSVEISKKEEFNLNVKKLRIGLPKEYFIQGLDEKIKKIIENVANFYHNLGAEIIEVSLPHTEYALPCYYIIAPSEASANLARYDGIKYGKATSEKEDILHTDLINYYFKVRGEGFGKEVKRRIMLGTYCLSSGYYDAYYKRALKVRTKIIEDFEKAFNKVDVILAPTTPTPAFKIGEKSGDPLSMYLSDIYTVSVNLAGLAAISVPAGNIDGLPIGAQFIAPPFTEEKLFAVTSIFENNYDFTRNS